MLFTVFSRVSTGLAAAVLLSSTTPSQAADTPAAVAATPATSAVVAKKKPKTAKLGADIKAGGTGPELGCTTKPHGAGVKGPGIPKCPQDLAPAAASKP